VLCQEAKGVGLQKRSQWSWRCTKLLDGSQARHHIHLPCLSRRLSLACQTARMWRRGYGVEALQTGLPQVDCRLCLRYAKVYAGMFLHYGDALPMQMLPDTYSKVHAVGSGTSDTDVELAGTESAVEEPATEKGWRPLSRKGRKPTRAEKGTYIGNQAFLREVRPLGLICQRPSHLMIVFVSFLAAVLKTPWQRGSNRAMLRWYNLQMSSSSALGAWHNLRCMPSCRTMQFCASLNACDTSDCSAARGEFADSPRGGANLRLADRHSLVL